MHRKLILFVCAGILLGLVIWALRQLGVADVFSPTTIKETILGYGMWAPFVYMGLYVVASVLFIPGSPLTLAGGAIFGPLYGTIYTIIGATMGAFLAFCLSRYFKQRFVRYGEGQLAKKLEAYDEKIGAHGFLTVLFLRFVPLFPFNGLNYGLGFTKVTVKDYFFGTLFGIIPGTFAYVYFGDSLASFNITKIAGAIVLVVALSFLGKMAMKRYHTN